GDPATAIYQRDPGVEKKPVPALSLSDYLFPALQIGYLRGGAEGRNSALMLSASDWGGHHHVDSLNLVWWQNGTEQLSDLGYLWDHPLKTMTTRTLAHNTVMIDGEDQQTTGRGGKFLLFESSRGIKVMEAESRAYPKADMYRRTVTQIETAPGQRYVMDIFRVRGGTQHDYVFHGPNNALTSAASIAQETQSIPGKPLDLVNLSRLTPISGQISLTWKTGENKAFTALWPTEPEEVAFRGDGWGQLDYKNSDAGATLPYIVRRRTGIPGDHSPAVFAGVFEGHEAAGGSVRTLTRLPVPAAEAANTVALRVETGFGVDYVVSCVEPRPVTIATDAGPLTVSGRFAVVRTVKGSAVGSLLVGGKQLQWRGKRL
ncbi:MAG: heparinase II/III family protein, partial [Armatimonadota bacterium]